MNIWRSGMKNGKEGDWDHSRTELESISVWMRREVVGATEKAG